MGGFTGAHIPSFEGQVGPQECPPASAEYTCAGSKVPGLDWILEQNRNVGGEAGRIQIQPGAELIVTDRAVPDAAVAEMG